MPLVRISLNPSASEENLGERVGDGVRRALHIGSLANTIVAG